MFDQVFIPLFTLQTPVKSEKRVSGISSVGERGNVSGRVPLGLNERQFRKKKKTSNIKEKQNKAVYAIFSCYVLLKRVLHNSQPVFICDKKLKKSEEKKSNKNL